MSASKQNLRGTRTSTIRGSKPSVAFASERDARANIASKIDLLVAQLKAFENGAPLENNLPRTVRQFNRWTPKSTKGALRANAQITLKKYPELLDLVTKLTSAIVQLERSKEKSDTRGERVVAARRAQNMHWILRMIAERAVVKAWREIAAAQEEILILRARLSSLEDEARFKINEAAEIIQGLEKENSQLRSDQRRVIPFGPKS